LDIYFICWLRVLAVLVTFSGDFSFYQDAEGPGDYGWEGSSYLTKNLMVLESRGQEIPKQST
jgi:hypothetical protein